MARPSAPPLILELLSQSELQVGDYGREHLFYRSEDGVYQIKLEGWGAECVPEYGGRKARFVARAEAEKLAASWKKAGWPRVGWFPCSDRDVWAMTWAMNGPLSGALADDEESEDI